MDHFEVFSLPLWDISKTLFPRLQHGAVRTISGVEPLASLCVAKTEAIEVPSPFFLLSIWREGPFNRRVVNCENSSSVTTVCPSATISIARMPGFYSTILIIEKVLFFGGVCFLSYLALCQDFQCPWHTNGTLLNNMSNWKGSKI